MLNNNQIKELNSYLFLLKDKVLTEKKADENSFGIQRSEDSLIDIIRRTYQTAFGTKLYPNIQTKVSYVFYTIIKGHTFRDGNKRMAMAVVQFLINTEYPKYILNTIEKEIMFDMAVEIAKGHSVSVDNKILLILQSIINPPKI